MSKMIKLSKSDWLRIGREFGFVREARLAKIERERREADQAAARSRASGATAAMARMQGEAWEDRDQEEADRDEAEALKERRFRKNMRRMGDR